MKKVKKEKGKLLTRIPPLIILFIMFLIAVLIYLKPYKTSDIALSPTYSSGSDINKSILEKILNFKRKNEEPKVIRISDFEQLASLIKSKSGTYSLYIKNMNTQKKYELNQTNVVYSASLYKVPTAVAVMRMVEDNKITLKDKITYVSQDYEEGSGFLQSSKVGSSHTVEDLLGYLLKQSDNVAQNMFLRIIPPGDLYNAFNLLNKQSAFIKDNRSSALEIGEYLEQLYSSDYLTNESKNYLFDLLKETSFDDRISIHLKEELTFSHKIGNWPPEGNWHDCGIVFGKSDVYVVCLMSTDTSYEEFLDVGKNLAGFMNTIAN